MYECLLPRCALCAALNGCIRSRYSDISHVQTVGMLMWMQSLAILMIALPDSVLGAIMRAPPDVDARPTAQRIFVGFDCRELNDRRVWVPFSLDCCDQGAICGHCAPVDILQPHLSGVLCGHSPVLCALSYVAFAKCPVVLPQSHAQHTLHSVQCPRSVLILL